MGLGKSCLRPLHHPPDQLAPFFRKLLPSWEASGPGHRLCTRSPNSLIPVPSGLASVAHPPLLLLFSTWLTSLRYLQRCQEAQVHTKLVFSHRPRCSPQECTQPAVPRVPGKSGWTDTTLMAQRILGSLAFCLKLLWSFSSEPHPLVTGTGG